MLHYKQKQHRRSQKFFHWSAKSTVRLLISGCWWYNANGRSHYALAFYTTKKMTHITATPKNLLHWQQGFFPHRIKGRDLVTYCNQQS